MTTVLVTGATGTVGSALVPLLTARGVAVSALTRDPSRAQSILGDNVAIQRGDFADPASLRAAAEAVDAVFLACSNVPDQVAYECAMIDEAARAGVRQIVKLSARGVGADAPVGYWRWHHQIERHLVASKVPAVMLRPSFLMTNFLAAADQVRNAGMLFAPVGTASISMIHPADVAEIAAIALTTQGHQGQSYVLTGPEAISYAEVASHVSAATGQSVGYADIPSEAAHQALVQAGLPPFAAEQFVAVFAALRDGAQATTTDTVHTLTGRAARPFADFAREYASAFSSGGVPVGS
jgi:uncharacterized protein YbjT (DUF2867 family)